MSMVTGGKLEKLKWNGKSKARTYIKTKSSSLGDLKDDGRMQAGKVEMDMHIKSVDDDRIAPR